MDKLKRKRTPLRSTFTKTVNCLKTELSKHIVNKGEMLDVLTKIETVFSEIKILDDKIIDLMLDDKTCSETDIETEMDENSKYLDEFIKVKRLVKERISASKDFSENETSEIESISISKSKRYKLPKLNIKQFDSKLINYLSFWSQFKKIHEDEELEDCDKFQYLIQSVEPGTRARKLLESYPITSENYSKAVAAFQERFGDKDLLIEVYVRELLNLIVSNVRASGKDRLSLSDLFTKLEAYLRALESMGVDSKTNAAWLFPMIESSLPDDVLRAWQRFSVFGKQNFDGSNISSNLNLLMEFLKGEVASEERLQLAKSGFENFAKRDNVKEKVNFKNTKISTAANLFSAKGISCLFCNKAHESKDCVLARSFTLEEMKTKVKNKNCCLKCLRVGHRANVCKVYVKCHVCSKPHTELFCPELAMRKESETKSSSPELLQSNLANERQSKEVALMTLQVVIKGNKSKKVRALCDTGSQRSYILKRVATELGLKPLSTETLAHTLFGGTQTQAKSHTTFRIELQALGTYSKSSIIFDVLDQDKICSDVPRVPKGPLLKELKANKMWVSDIGPGSPEIELLIGSDLYGQLLTGRVKHLQNGLTAIQTKLGWTICGQLDCSAIGTASIITNLVIEDMKIPDLWKLETIGIRDPSETLSKAEEEALAQEQFMTTLSRNEDGRYCVGLPWITDNKVVPSNRNIAERRLFSITRRLKSLGKIKEYDEVFQEWFREGVIEPVPEEELNRRSHYLPHHAVFKPNSPTTKIRPVFDASCKIGRNPSLNDCLVKGPNLIELIPSILLRFREKNIGVIADIRRAFLQIEIVKQDRDFLRFLWWKNDETVQEFRHNRVVFGARCSPFLLGAVIRYHLTHAPDTLKETADKLSKSLYIDNCVTSVENQEELEEFKANSIKLLADAKMELRLWVSGPEDENGPIAENCDPISSVLGLQWERKDDYLLVNLKTLSIPENLSKRKVLSLTQSIFDPLGFLTPVLLPAKLLLQEVWAKDIDWDTPLPNEVKSKFTKWYNDLQSLIDFKIPRRIGFGDKSYWSLHIFCDSSQNAYATVIFLRCETEYEVFVSFLASKARVAPLKRITIPRLELLACLLGARLSKYVAEALSLTDTPRYYWTDSTTALSWIKRDDRWGTFVGNRVKEICAISDASQWYYVPTQYNPADLPSRGCSPRQFLKNAWLEGPEFLKKPPEAWPHFEFSPDDDSVAAEIKKKKVIGLSVKIEKPEWFERFSSYSKVIQVFCWILRFVYKLLKKPSFASESLTVEEKSCAETILWSFEQKKYFQEKENSVHGLLVIRDENGLLRVKSKIIERDDEFCFLYPILLPSRHYLTECLIREYHLKNCHAGVQILAAKLRQRYWILSCKRSIRCCVSRCVVCKKFSAKAFSTPPIQLPLDRVRDSSVFETTGVDLCGPLLLKPKGKAWVVLFTCAVYRAIHLEPITALSTEAFLQALRRFIARRGRPATVYSDNGTNFTGTYNALKRLNWQKIENECHPIKWKFIPPTAAWWGGWWERLIRSVKALLLRILGRSSVNFEELLTILCDVESTINSRPLTFISDGSDELVPLTPSMFLQDITQVGVPDLDRIDSEKLNVRVKHCNTLRQELRSRFRKEYLSQLVQKASVSSQQLKVGDIVLIEIDNKKRVLWPMGKIIKIYKSRDGATRVVQLKTGNGFLVRPIKKLYPLEVSTAGDPVITATAENRSRYGRLLKSKKT